MNIDPRQETAALIVRASDHERTPGEQAAHEEADRCVTQAARQTVLGSTGDAMRLTLKATEWRYLAERARAEDLAAAGGQS